MSQPSEKAKAKRPQRWFQISVRTLLVLVTLAAIAAGAWRWYTEPFRRQRHAMAAIEKAGGSYETVPGGPAWLRRVVGESSFQNVVFVNVADCGDPAEYIDYVVNLPALETLVVGGQSFADEHLQQFHAVATLQGVVLDCTEVSQAGLAALRDALPKVEIYESQCRAIAAIESAGGKLQSFKGRKPAGPNLSHPRLVQRLEQKWFEEPTHAYLIKCRDVDVPPVTRLARLQSLVIDGGQVTDDGIAHLRSMTHLHSLILDRVQITDNGLAHLKGLTQLGSLGLGWTKITDRGLESLKAWTKLFSLGLTETRITDAGLVHVAGLSKLHDLHLNGTRITDAGLEHLKALHLLTSLRLKDTQVGDSGLAHLRVLPKLAILELDRTNVTDAGMEYVGQMHRLVLLQLSGTRVGDTGLAQLSALRSLRDLRLGSTQVSDAGMRHLESLTSLMRLYLENTRVSDSGLVHLKALKNLVHVIVPSTVSAAGLRDLKRALPNCAVDQDTVRRVP
jgi:hypothetical protein